MIVYGINPVREALRAGGVTGLRIGDRAGGRVAEILRDAERAGVEVRHVAQAELDRAARGGVHQGVVADVEEREALGLEDLLVSAASPALFVVLDGIEDPHNLGAILRSADGAGVDGVVRQSRHAAPLSGIAAKASAGAASHVKVADVVNIARAVEQLKDAGIWTVGLDGDAERAYDDVDLTLPTAFVIGAEGAGLRRLVRERCDFLVSIPMSGHVQSLNASVATGVVLFEAQRQRRLEARLKSRDT